MNETDAVLARFLNLHPKQIDLSLDRIVRLLDDLGNPHRAVPPVIHVAGTNGKGSTIAFLRAMLEAHGLAVHVYTSPHLVNFNERIRLGQRGGAGRLAPDSDILEALTRIEAVNAGRPITLFEITTVLGFMLFAHHPADVLLLEVGLGGLHDATNVIDAPLASVITPVSIDHTGFLGDKLAGIAREKAGIIKRGVPVIAAPQMGDARTVIEATAEGLRAPLFLGGQDWQAREERGRLVFEDSDGLMDLPLPRLLGRHQHDNAGTAIATLRVLRKWNITAAEYEKALGQVAWPARLQALTQGALLAHLPEGAEIWLDGSHNEAGAKVLAAAMGEWEERSPRPLVMIAGMLNTKDSEGFFRAFGGLVQHVYAVPIPNNASSRSPEAIAAYAQHAGIAASGYADLDAAFAALCGQKFEKPPRILITGSLYLAGEVLKRNGTPPL